MGEEIVKYRTFVNAPQIWFEKGDENLKNQIITAYQLLIKHNNLNHKMYNPLLTLTYENDDFIQARITLIIEAEPINPSKPATH